MVRSMTSRPCASPWRRRGVPSSTATCPSVRSASVEGEVVASNHNERELRHDPTAHAEILALRAASEALGTWRLDKVTIVVTLEPCPMCAGAIVAARVGRLVFGAADPKAGACGSLYQLCNDPRLNHELPVTPGVLEEEAGAAADGLLRIGR